MSNRRQQAQPQGGYLQNGNWHHDGSSPQTKNAASREESCHDSRQRSYAVWLLLMAAIWLYLLQGEWRTAITMAIHSGEVCTMCRTTPWETTPTTRRAAIIATQQMTSK